MAPTAANLASHAGQQRPVQAGGGPLVSAETQNAAQRQLGTYKWQKSVAAAQMGAARLDSPHLYAAGVPTSLVVAATGGLQNPPVLSTELHREWPKPTT